MRGAVSRNDTLTIPALLAHLARWRGDCDVVVTHARRLSYAQAEAESARLARGLVAAGVGKGTRVGLLAPNGPEWVVAWLAASRIGALVVPICTFYQPRELAWVLGHADVQILLAASPILGKNALARLEEAAPELVGCDRALLHLRALPRLREVWVWGACDRAWAKPMSATVDALLAAHPRVDDDLLRAIEADVSPADAAVLVYTSGSTAEPKGVVHTHGNLVRRAHHLNERRKLRADDRLYTPMPLFWVGGLHTGLLACMDAGACLLCDESFDPERALDLLERERATLVLGWPYHGKALAEHPSFAARDLSSLRDGARNALPPAHSAARDPELRPNWLGMTETFGPHCAGEMDGLLPPSLRGSFGTPLPDAEHRVIDPESGETLPRGEEGEICVRGAALMQGLYKVEREQTFEPDGFYRTGDRGWFDDEGHLHFVGRAGDVIKTSGANVAPREVELVLESFPDVKEAHVVGLPDDVRGEIVAAAVVSCEGASVDTDALLAHARAELASFKVPRHIFVMKKSDLPETSTGKIQKGRLRELLQKRR